VADVSGFEPRDLLLLEVQIARDTDAISLYFDCMPAVVMSERYF
jgi:hypothetical protein